MFGRSKQGEDTAGEVMTPPTVPPTSTFIVTRFDRVTGLLVETTVQAHTVKLLSPEVLQFERGYEVNGVPVVVIEASFHGWNSYRELVPTGITV